MSSFEPQHWRTLQTFEWLCICNIKKKNDTVIIILGNQLTKNKNKKDDAIQWQTKTRDKY